VTVLAVGCRDRSLARGAAATVLGLVDFIFGEDGSTGASLSSLFDLNRLRTKLPMLPEFPVEAGVPSEVHPASTIAAATTVAVRNRAHRR
jgi:hypothetical protein